MTEKKRLIYFLTVPYGVFLAFSWQFDFTPGKIIGNNFFDFLLSMAAILPVSFVLIGLFEVWINRQTVEKHFGHASGYRGYLWAIILSGTTVGGAYVAFPVGHALYKKGARLSIVLTYIGSAALTRIPMTIFEASFLGFKFALIRLGISLPLVILSSIFIGGIFDHRKS
ncbi:MAG: hypothetical protein AVO33_08460 [delta proteobacterium ML8_F1]|nr:MAG: hypothetical protein AVO33_08460 [delta proteobacterium ML8_F1]